MTCALQNGKGGYGERGGPRGVWEGGGEQTAARLGGRPGDGSAARREARTETAARLGGRPGGWAAARLGGRHGGGSAARREARRWQRGSEGGPETVRFGERECGEVEEAVQCSHSKSHSPFLK